MDSSLRTAAQQALEFCEFLWREVVLNDWAEGQREATEAALRAALAEPVQDVKGCDHCEQPLYAAIKCKVCGRVTEPVQEWASIPGTNVRVPIRRKG